MASQLVYAGDALAALHTTVLPYMTERAKNVLAGVVNKQVDQVLPVFGALTSDENIALIAALVSHPNSAELVEWWSAVLERQGVDNPAS